MENKSEKELAKHRVIGIKHALKVLRESGLISEGVDKPADAVLEISQKLEDVENRAINAEEKVLSAKRFRIARSDCSIPTMISTIEYLFYLPQGSVSLIYPNGNKAKSNLTVGHLRNKWEK